MKKNIIEFFIAILIILFVCELFLKVFFPLHLTGGYIGNYKYDLELGYVIKGGYTTKISDYKQEIYVNKIGTVNFQDDFVGYKHLIFTLGDSYTQGTGLPIDGSYPAQLDLMLNLQNSDYKKLYGVVNLGLAAFGGSQSVLTYLRYKQKIGEPKYILYLGCDNDFYDDLLFSTGEKHRNLVDQSPYYGLLQKPLAYFLTQVEIGKRLNYVRRVLYRKNLVEKPESDQFLKSQLPHLEKIIKSSQKAGTILLVSWADSPKDSESYNNLKIWALQNKIIFVDWYPMVESVSKNLPALPIENDHSGGHYRVWVNTLIAKAMYDKITEVDSKK